VHLVIEGVIGWQWGWQWVVDGPVGRTQYERDARAHIGIAVGTKPNE
jgi:hypothetical protein